MKLLFFAPFFFTVAVGFAQPPAPPKQGLSVVRPTLHYRQEEGAPIAPTYQYTAGELLYLSFRISGFTAVKDKVDLRWQLVAVDPEGVLLMAPLNGSVTEELTDNDKNWLPKVTQTLPLPAQLPPGTYQLKLHIADELAKTSTDHEIGFRVSGRPLPAVKGLTILNLHFLRTPTDRQPMEPAIYHPGETLIARFELAGFQLGEKNKFEVDYGLSVLNAAGKVLFTQPNAASETNAPFYPQRLLNGELTLNLNAGVLAAEYQLLVKVRDHVANTETEAGAKFTVQPPPN
ncbi:hypothetical protein [uncultured Paludibaculum sp.]|uniref:hypothetical protein n=1 Tax=uncultured Paludibaculum sp. TaxID=1765020 RepID=UPI002AAB9A74|nr:hypothetical protein [uncultured Paludibaculum sp.]